MNLDRATFVVSDVMRDPTHFMVNYSIGNFCNYDCSYCWPWTKSGTDKHRDFIHHTEFFDDLKQQIYDRGFRSMTTLFTGGEPTTYKFLPQLIKNYANNFDKLKYHIVLNTNLSPSVNYFNKLKKLTPNIGMFQIAASFHHDHTDFETFSKKILAVRDLGYTISIREVVEPSTFDFCVDLVNKFEQIGLFCELKLRTDITVNFSGKTRVPGFTDEMLATLKKIREESPYNDQAWPTKYIVGFDDYTVEAVSEVDFFNDDSHVFTGWRCQAGINHLAVNSNGQIRRCWDTKGPNYVLGNVYKKDFKFPTQPIICPVKFCTSSTGTQTLKERI
jgi:sulfatase maturation enzyme AslB (radical SAM superfamily)